MPIQYQPPSTATPPGGSDTEVQFNDNGVFSGVPGATYDGADLFLDGPVISDDVTEGVRLGSDAAPGNIKFQCIKPNERTNVSFSPNGTVANYPSLFSLFATDAIADPLNYEVVFFISKGSADTYHSICSFATGTGTRRPLNIEANGSIGVTPQLIIGTDNGVSIGTGTAAGGTNLLVAGTITGSNLSGTNTGDQTLNPTTVGLGNVTNDVQTKSAIVPNTAPSAGQILSGNAGGTAYAPVTLSGSGVTATLSALGVLTLSAIANATLSNSTMTLGGTSVSLGGSIEFLNTTIRPTASYTVPANFSSVVAGGSLIIDAGLTLTLSSGAVMKIL